ncbi:uncharacterized protein LOC113874275 [Abrus precatorius]|uniref:Uncharacterized protein LOC113874275 n=1 Tax=Abrus precatorius TaxID=3816 RepID=A0A8B8MK81_ABRPR|nr:uncharacterized protein LOC113874275 [Abrus precatorius]
MDDFTVYGSSFDACLDSLSKVLDRCIQFYLVLNCEKCHFMVTERTILRHVVSSRGLETDRAKIDVIVSLPYPTSVKEVALFLTMQKDTDFIFDQTCKDIFDELKRHLTSTSIIQPSSWEILFEHMCDALNFAIGAVLGQKFDIEIKDRCGAENLVADHLSRIQQPLEDLPIRGYDSWCAYLVNYLAAKEIPTYFSKAQTAKMKSDSKYYICDDPYLWKMCSDKIIRRYVPEPEFQSDAHNFCKTCEQCQRTGNISGRNEMPQLPLLFCEVFDEWDTDFISLFPVTFGYTYILLVVDYVSKWVEAKATRTDDTRVVVDFVKSYIFYKFGFFIALISDQRSHFCNRIMATLLQKFGVMHKVFTPYHPQTNGQAETSNREIKQILEKTVLPNKKDLSLCLEEAL